MFMDNLITDIRRKNVTEKGAVGYSTFPSALVEFNYKLSSYRNAPSADIIKDFRKACVEDMALATIYLFYMRDIRGGLGERRTFRICFKWMLRVCTAKEDEALLRLIPEYGRWDDLIDMWYERPEIISKILTEQLIKDVKNMHDGKPISLLAKWMPSENASSAETKAKASFLRKELRISAREYRIMLSRLRKYLKVVETKMSAGKWDQIDYEEVPSRAALRYTSAFKRHDPEGYGHYKFKLMMGTAKINSAANFPYQIVSQYRGHNYPDIVLEKAWQGLADYGKTNQKVLVVADGSGSMYQTCGQGVQAIDVANSLAIYFSERLEGEFKNSYITFSYRPQIVRFGEGTPLFDKMNYMRQYCEVANTNIEKVFDLILRTACENNLAQAEIPDTILIISDMEFDQGTSGRTDRTLFEEFQRKFAKAGYKLPKIAFWNVCSRTSLNFLQENENGVVLVSGFSPAAINMVLSGELNPVMALREQLNNKRYDAVREAIYGTR